MKVLSDLKLKAKKEHYCNFCNDKISIGEVYNRQSNVLYNHFFMWRSHIKCQEIAYKLDMYNEVEDCLDADSFRECINNENDNINPDNTDKNFSDILNNVIKYHKI